MDKRFDFLLAYYIFCNYWHGGQDCPLYAKLSRVKKRLKLSPLFSESETLQNDNEVLKFYLLLVKRYYSEDYQQELNLYS